DERHYDRFAHVTPPSLSPGLKCLARRAAISRPETAREAREMGSTGVPAGCRAKARHSDEHRGSLAAGKPSSLARTSGGLRRPAGTEAGAPQDSSRGSATPSEFSARLKRSHFL